MATKRRPRRGQSGYVPDEITNLRVRAETDQVFEVGERIAAVHGTSIVSRTPVMIVIEGVRDMTLSQGIMPGAGHDADDYEEMLLQGINNVEFQADATSVQLVHDVHKANRIRMLCQPPVRLPVEGRLAGRNDEVTDDDTYGFINVPSDKKDNAGRAVVTLALRDVAFIGKHGAARPEVIVEGLRKLGVGDRTRYMHALAAEFKKQIPSRRAGAENEAVAHMMELVMALEGYKEPEEPLR